MKRRQFLRQGTAGAVAGGILAGCGAREPVAMRPATSAGPNVIWRLASSYPPSLDTLYGASTTLADRVGQLTGGRFKIYVAAAGEVVPPLQVLDAVQQGSVQAGHTAGYYYIGKHPALAFDTTLPFGLTARQQLAWMYEGGGLDSMRSVYADFGILNFPGGCTGAQMGGWFREPIHSLDDLKGLKMRIPGMGGKVMDRLGVSVQVLGGAEIFPALERGAIDATEWVGPYDDYKLGFHTVAKHYYYPGWWEPGPMLSFLVNRGQWDQLPADYQAAFACAAAEAGQTMMTRYDAQNPAALQQLLGEGVELHRFSDPIMKAAQREFAQVIEDTGAENADYARIYRDWKRFRDASVRWFGTAEEAFLRFVSSPA